ncbi:poly-gamma-glutamate hydrolase family protein [Oceanobacillus jeddahense]|uniref:Poly-gamma-glutamate hydrolase family protein n=1 Tax=Oceanobacillus jeddahense TaxID=1462527 RepID=A0ABY5JTT0_9BACI|nr:poly-gamma-glutamate hydrolase family protein [Oceanobacillus jeddahense]UUI02486.1 poly-gamma-glutamate hydrolase family protein [Oceanobacillus jeddahense]
MIIIAILLATGTSENDTYENFKELSEHEHQDEDYRIRSGKGNPDVMLIAIHGGGIEPGTTELAEQSALAGEYSFYSFQGIKLTNNTELHITSTNFDESEALALVSDSLYTVSFHGYEDEVEKHTYVGGLDKRLSQSIEKELKNAGFLVSDAPKEFDGKDKDNIVNKNKQEKGVQLEISTAQRKAFFEDNDFLSENRENQTEEFDNYIEAIQKGLEGV